MKHGKFFPGFLVLICTAVLFLGCPTDPEDEEPNYGGEAKTLAVSVATSDGTVYYSLSTKEAVSDPASTAWDIAFKRTRLILTNSGDTATALSSGGQGGVWYSGKTDFDSVSLDDKGADDADFSTDTDLYLWTGMGPAPTATTPLNVMTYVGYGHGDGSTNETDGWTAGDPVDYTNYPANGPLTDYKYNADQYYTQTHSEGGGPVFGSSGKVYIIKHGDGTHYSKIQITYEYVSSGAKDTFSVKFSNF
ncbi:MAG: HmuY family protein [Treponema sp.]|jgi:hypothetical protein|nr:HmuY family protein [Treponema sp.]